MVINEKGIHVIMDHYHSKRNKVQISPATAYNVKLFIKFAYGPTDRPLRLQEEELKARSSARAWKEGKKALEVIWQRRRKPT